MPDLNNQLETNRSNSSNSLANDKSDISERPVNNISDVELEPYKAAIKRHINSYIKSK